MTRVVVIFNLPNIQTTFVDLFVIFVARHWFDRITKIAEVLVTL